MDMTFFVSALFFISTLTALTVEAIKKLMGENKKCNSDVLAAIVSFVLSIATSICYIIYNSIQFSAQTIIAIIAYVFFSFLCATVGYDKVFKAIFEKLFKKNV